MVLLWTSWFVLCRLDKSVIYLPGIISWFGIILVVAGVILFLVALFTIKTLETFKGDLITYGIYSKIRHPMYLGFLFWSIGSPVFYGALYSFILAILFSINVLYWRHLEEIELVNRFPGYISYKAKTIF
jgi:protein-S-isoprenylcysteine O-methyltransferase Ste14